MKPNHTLHFSAHTLGVLVVALLLTCFRASADTNRSLVAYWQFNGDAKSATNGLVAVLNNAAFGSGIVDLALATDGRTNSYAEVAPSEFLNVTQAVSVSLWIKVRKYSAGFACLVYKSAAKPTDQGFADRAFCLWLTTDGAIELGSTPEGASAQVYCTTRPGLIPVDDQFHHVVGLVDAVRGKIRVYVAGALEQAREYPRGAIHSGEYPMRLGAPFVTLEDQAGFDGLMDEVRIYNRALTQSDVQELFTGEPIGPMPSISVSTVRVTWESSLHHRYQVQSRPLLTEGPWSDLGPPLEGTDGPLFVEDSVLSDPQRIYRVLELSE